MSNLPLQSAVNHNDDNDEQTNSTNSKLSTLNSRITSPLIIKRQQNTETEIANNQAYDEIHDLQPKHSLSKKINTDNSFVKNSTRQHQSYQITSRELMQGNYYDQTRYNIDYNSSSNHQSEPILIDINVEDYKKTFSPITTSKNSNNKNQTRSPPFGDTSESIQEGIAQSAGILLELNKNSDHHQHKSAMKTSIKSHEQAVINYFPNENETNDNNKQRSLSPSSSDCSSSDTSTSNKSHEENTKTNIPYETLLNDDDNDDEQVIEQTKKPLNESSILLNKNHSLTYGTQSTTNIQCERSKYLPNNGYNSHGSSITTKSSSDNSGSIRTNSGTDNDEESDVEPYNNSTISNNPLSMSISDTKDAAMKSLNKTNDAQDPYLNEQKHYKLKRMNTTQINNNDKPHSQASSIKQLHIDDLNGNVNTPNATTGPSSTVFQYKSSPQLSSNNQTNNSSSSSHQNRNNIERNEQQQQNSIASRNNTRQHQARAGKKRKQCQQQEIIRTESIPGHRGDLDVDALVMFIDGDSSKQQQNSTPLRPADTNKPRLSSKINSLNDPNSNKTLSRKKSRKSLNSLQESISSTITNNENTTSDYLETIERNIQSINFNNEDNQTNTQIISNITMNTNESHLNIPDMNSTKTINGQTPRMDSHVQTHTTSFKTDDIDSHGLSSTIANTLNSEIIAEPFVTVKNRRRLIKERRQDNNLPIYSTNFTPSSKANDRRRITSSGKFGFPTRTITRKNLPYDKLNSSWMTKEETNNRVPQESIRTAIAPPSNESSFSSPTVNSTIEKPAVKQQSPHLSSHSSSSSLSSLLKRQSKPPPVVFLNKSIDIELNDVSFGFEIDSTTLNKSSEDDSNNNQAITAEQNFDTTTTTSISPSIQPTQSNDTSHDSTTQRSNRKNQQRNNRSPQFYSGSDIRAHQQRPYPTQPMPQPSYIDPLLLFQYNQRIANYTHPLAYMNLYRTQYIPHQSPYVFVPTTFSATANGTATTTTTTTTAATTTTMMTNEPDGEDTTNQTSSEQVQEPLYVYTTPTGQVYYHPPVMKKSSIDSEQPSSTSIPTVYTAPVQPMYPSSYFYASHGPHMIPPHPAYFQPIQAASSSLLIETKSEQNNMDTDNDEYKTSTTLYPQIRQQSSADIMSNALKLVYSHQQRNAQTDRFNLDDLTAYLAKKWTDTVEHYEKGIEKFPIN